MATVEFHGADLVVSFHQNSGQVPSHYLVQYVCATGTVTHRVEWADAQSEDADGIRHYQDTLTYADNKAAGLTRTPTVVLTAVAPNGDRSDPVLIAAQNSIPVLPAPPAIIPTLTGVTVELQTPSDADVVGYVAWVDGNTNVRMDDARRRYQGSSTSFSLSLADDTTYQLRVAPYDAFGLDFASAWPPIAIHRLASPLTDVDAPAAPGGLAFGAPTFRADGRVDQPISWTANTEQDFAAYELQAATNGGGWISVAQGTTPTFVFADLLPATALQVRVRAADRSGNLSGWSTTLAGTIAKDGTPPGIPTLLSVTSSLGGMRVQWVNPTDSDLAQTTVWESAGTDFGAAIKSCTVNAVPGQLGTYVRNGLSAGTSRNFWVQSVDASGNVSPPTSPQSGSVGLIDYTDFDLSIQPIGKVSSLPNPAGYVGPQAVIVDSDKKLYRYVNGAWAKDVDGSDLTAGSVSTHALAAQSVTASQLAIGDFNNLILNNDFRTDTSDDVNVTPSGWCRRAGTGNGNTINVVSAGPGSTWPTERCLYFRRNLASDTIEISITSGLYNFDTDTVAQGGFAVGLNEEFYVQCVGAFFGGAVLQADLIFRSNDGTFLATDSQPVTNYTAAGNFTTCTTILKNKSGRSGKGYLRFSHNQNGSPTNGADLYVWNLFVGRRNGGKLIVDGGIKASQIDVASLNASSAWIGQLDAGVLKSSSSLPGQLSITGTGFNLATLANATNDPAGRINANSTLITPGKIQLAGGTTLTNWLYGGDNTLINGGALAANTVTANKVTVGIRGVQLLNIAFDTDRNNTCSWSEGYIDYMDEAGNRQVAHINAGSATRQLSGSYVLYIWFDRAYSAANQVLVAATTTPDQILNNPNNVIVAAYFGGTSLTTNYGQTIVDGDYVKTGTLQANRLISHSLTSDQIAVGGLRAESIQAGSIDTQQLSINGVQWQNLSVGQLGRYGSGSATWSSAYVPTNGETITLPFGVAMGTIKPSGGFTSVCFIGYTTNAGQRYSSTYNGYPAYTDIIGDGGVAVYCTDNQGNTYSFPNGTNYVPVYATTEFNGNVGASISHGNYDTGYVSQGDYYTRRVSADWTVSSISLTLRWAAI